MITKSPIGKVSEFTASHLSDRDAWTETLSLFHSYTCSGFLFGSLWPYRSPVTEKPIGGLPGSQPRPLPGHSRSIFYLPSASTGSDMVGLYDSGSRVFFRLVFYVRLYFRDLYTECSFSPGGSFILRRPSGACLHWSHSLPAESSFLVTFICSISTDCCTFP